MPYVRIKNGPAKGQRFEIKAEPVSIGRDTTCGIQILDKGASRVHSEVFRIGEMCFVRDLQSRNGSFVNDNRIEEELLRDGDRIQIGATVLVFEAGASKDENEGGFEFSEGESEEVGSTLELRLEDLSAANVGEGDGSEAARLRAIYRLGRILAEERDEQSLIDKVLPFVCEQLRADVGYLFTRDAQKGTIAPIGSYQKTVGRTAKVSRSIIRRAIQEKRALLTSDAMQDTRFSAQDSILIKEIHSVICVPLSVSGDLSGVLYLATDNPGASFTEEELEQAAAMADPIGLAIMHIRSRKTQRDHLISTIRVLVRAVEKKTPLARGHSERVAHYMTTIGRNLELPVTQIEYLQLAGYLHNIGNLIEGAQSFYDPEQPLQNLTDREKQVHFALELINGMDDYAFIEKTIRYQLERTDGSGPQGLKGEEIPIGARILAVAIEFDGIANNPAVQDAAEKKIKDAVIELGRQSGRTLDKEVVQALLKAHRDGTLHETPPETPA